MAVNPANAAPMVPGDDGEGFCNARSTGVCGGLSEAWRISQERLDFGGDLVGASCPRPLEENSLPRRSPSPCSPAEMYLGAIEEEQTQGGGGYLEGSKEVAGLVKRDRVAWMSQQARYIAGQLVLRRTSPHWQLVRRISGRKRRVGRLVAALKDEDGRVISTPEAAAAMWERKFLGAFSGIGELRDVTERGDEGRCSEGDATLAGSGAETAVSEEEWLPLISDALATAKRGQAAGPDALPAELLKAGGMWLLRICLAWPLGLRWQGSGGVARRPDSPSPQESDAPFALQNCRGTWQARLWLR